MAEAALQTRPPIERTAPDTIRLERLLDAAPEAVWRLELADQIAQDSAHRVGRSHERQAREHQPERP